MSLKVHSNNLERQAAYRSRQKRRRAEEELSRVEAVRDEILLRADALVYCANRLHAATEDCNEFRVKECGAGRDCLLSEARRLRDQAMCYIGDHWLYKEFNLRLRERSLQGLK